MKRGNRFLKKFTEYGDWHAGFFLKSCAFAGS
jgi:hypothetical protein